MWSHLVLLYPLLFSILRSFAIAAATSNGLPVEKVYGVNVSCSFQAAVMSCIEKTRFAPIAWRMASLGTMDASQRMG